jgi:hypothetical protein
MLNLSGIVVAILKMATSRNFSMSGISSGHHNLLTYEMALKSTMLNLCGIVVAIFKMAIGRNFSMSGINPGHHYLTNVLKYHTCRSTHPEDRNLPITELKWDARTVTNIRVLQHIGFSHFSG